MKPLITTRFYPTDYLKEIFDTLDLWSNCINNNNNFSFIKFGDGELYCMMGAPGQNCDKHPYSPELGNKLIDAWNFFSDTNIKNIYIAEWGDQPGSFGMPQYARPVQNLNNPVFSFLQHILSHRQHHNFNFVNYEILMHHTVSEHKYNFFKCIKESNRKKIFVGPERLHRVQQFLNKHVHIPIPILNSFGAYDTILSRCLEETENNAIFIFCGSLPSKSLIHKILQNNSNVTCLDAGSSFDPLFVGGTREGQINTDILLAFYQEII
jgi:hypothetical protein